MLERLGRYFEERKMAGLYRKQQKMLDLIQLSIQTGDDHQSDWLLKKAGRLMDRISAGMTTNDQARALGLKLELFGLENPQAKAIALGLINETERRVVEKLTKLTGS